MSTCFADDQVIHSIFLQKIATILAMFPIIFHLFSPWNLPISCQFPFSFFFALSIYGLSFPIDSIIFPFEKFVTCYRHASIIHQSIHAGAQQHFGRVKHIHGLCEALTHRTYQKQYLNNLYGHHSELV